MLDKKYDDFLLNIIREAPRSPEDVLIAKKKVSGLTQLPIPTNADLRERYEKMIEEKRILRNPILEKALKTRNIRTSSGIAAVAVLTKSPKCPGNCLYCPTEPKMPKSYLSNEPAVMRAIASKFDPYRQVQNRLRSLELNGHAIDKLEIIILGGTFSFFSKSYQKRFVLECFRSANEYFTNKKAQKPKRKTLAKTIPALDQELKKQQKINETARCRIVGLTLETRPDYINEKEIVNFRQLGATRVELGVQSIFDDILKINRRGHTIEATIKATRLLKDAGFKINYHIMPGLPGSTPQKDYKMFHQLFHNPDFQPDYLKIYPTVVTRFSDLYKLWQEKKYRPLTDQVFGRLIKKIKNELIPPYVRIVRLVRDIPIPEIIAGPKISNLRQIISDDTRCQCIRCREVRENYSIQEDKLTMHRDIFASSCGQEIFLEYSTSDREKLFALLRLRFPSDKNNHHFIPALRKASLIREVHTYGLVSKLHEKSSHSPQHMGLGKKLIQEAERLSKENGFKKIAVIAGVGVREYYRKLGYRLQDSYLVKDLF